MDQSETDPMEHAQEEGSFDNPKYMFKQMAMKMTILFSKYLLI